MTTTATAQTKLYLTDNGTDRVSSSDLDGSNLLTLVQLSLNPIGIAVDAQNQKVYFVADGAIIQSVDGSGGEVKH